MRIMLVLFGLSMSITACLSDGKSLPPEERQSGSCVISGCADELCGDEPRVSPCIWREQYACYRDATCGRQGDGTCGWTATDELTSCLRGS
jgi:hypothetical protein